MAHRRGKIAGKSRGPRYALALECGIAQAQAKRLAKAGQVAGHRSIAARAQQAMWRRGEHAPQAAAFTKQRVRQCLGVAVSELA